MHNVHMEGNRFLDVEGEGPAYGRFVFSGQTTLEVGTFATQVTQRGDTTTYLGSYTQTTSVPVGTYGPHAPAQR
jgi:hypothetical protein